MNADDLIQMKRKIEELKSKKQRLEERARLLNEQRNNIVQECGNLGISIDSMEDETKKLNGMIEGNCKLIDELLGSIKV